MSSIQIRPVSSDLDWSTARQIRREVFIDEQSCHPDEEWDEHDDTARHFVGWVDDTPAAVARWRATRFDDEPVAKLERIAVRRPFRGRGFGRQVVRFLMQDAEQAGFDQLYLHAQAHLEDFYTSLGFETVGEPFDEAGIPHVPMLRRPT